MDDFDHLPAVEAGCIMPTARTIQMSDANCRTAAEMGSEGLLRALLHYGARYGLPSIGADECRRRLDALYG